MAEDIDEFWTIFQSLQDKAIRDQEDLAALRDVLSSLHELIDAVGQAALSHHEQQQLKLWLATFHDFCGQIHTDLNETAEAIAAFRNSLALRCDLETHVRLLEALCKLGAITEAADTCNALHRRGKSFTGTRDAESAAKVLQLLGTHPQFAEQIDTTALRDVLQAVAIRGIQNVVLKPLR